MVFNTQTKLAISGRTYTNSDDTWLGVNIPRTEPTALEFRDNHHIDKQLRISPAGRDEGAGSTNNNLDGAVITGNRFSWSGTNWCENGSPKISVNGSIKTFAQWQALIQKLIVVN